jgi:hypothetical protein
MLTGAYQQGRRALLRPPPGVDQAWMAAARRASTTARETRGGRRDWLTRATGSDIQNPWIVRAETEGGDTFASMSCGAFGGHMATKQ